MSDVTIVIEKPTPKLIICKDVDRVSVSEDMVVLEELKYQPGEGMIVYERDGKAKIYRFTVEVLIDRTVRYTTTCEGQKYVRHLYHQPEWLTYAPGEAVQEKQITFNVRLLGEGDSFRQEAIIQLQQLGSWGWSSPIAVPLDWLR